jgi:hypothetical protein
MNKIQTTPNSKKLNNQLSFVCIHRTQKKISFRETSSDR